MVLTTIGSGAPTVRMRSARRSHPIATMRAFSRTAIRFVRDMCVLHLALCALSRDFDMCIFLTEARALKLICKCPFKMTEKRAMLLFHRNEGDYGGPI